MLRRRHIAKPTSSVHFARNNLFAASRFNSSTSTTNGKKENEKEQQYTPESPKFTIQALSSVSKKNTIPFSVHAATAEMCGRRYEMEDAHFTFINKELKNTNKKVSLFGILDGHGGSTVAERASQYLPETLFDHPLILENTGKAFVESILKTDERLFNDEIGSGACSISAIFDEDKKMLTVASLGDCQAVLCEGKDTALTLSVEHKPDAPIEKARIVDRLGGRVNYDLSYKPGKYKISIYRVNNRLSLSRAFGDFGFKRGYKSEKHPKLLTGEEFLISNIADITTINISDESKFLVLGCDGLFDVMHDVDIIPFLNKYFHDNKKALEDDVDGTLKQAAEALIKQAYNERSQENISATIVLFHHPKSQKYGN